ncbi:MAG: TonB-dependent receptor, partial [Gemmatimonadetes bacterium]|nr:TonB-dependent receptor [Gemmatimonadota bacterium]
MPPIRLARACLQGFHLDFAAPRSSARPTARFVTVALGILAVLVSVPSVLLAQSENTGSIRGVAVDAAGKPIAFVNVLLQTGAGTIAGENGAFAFDNLAPGAYDLTFRHISVQEKTLKVVVRAGQATEIGKVALEEAAIRIEGFTYRKRAEKLQRTSSAAIRTIDTNETTKIRAINTTEEAIATQAGVVQLGDALFVRGGRSTEVKTVVDGMPVSDAFAGSGGSGTMSIAVSSQEGINVLTGGFDAEYGNAQSGIIEVATKEGGDTYEWQVKFLTDDFGAPDRTYFNYDNLSFGVGGPVPFAGDQWRFFMSGEGVFTDTYLKTLEERDAYKLTYNGNELLSLRPRQENATRGQVKVTYRFPGSAKKLSGEYLFSQSNDNWYHHAFSRVGYWSDAQDHWWFEPLDSTYTYYNGPEHVSTRTNLNQQYKMVYTHPITEDSYLKFRGALYETSYDEKVKGKNPNEYVPFLGNDTERDPENLFYAITGDFPLWEERRSKQYTARADYQNAVGQGTHELKTGVTLDYFDLFKDARQYPDEDQPTGNFPNTYKEQAFGGVVYVQDRLRYRKTMVMNVGLRMDFFDPGENAVRVTNQRVLALEKPTSGLSFLERWKAQISPRLGMSYPISDRDVLHFHYGRFFQLPDLELLYDFSNNPVAGNQLVGNAFLEPETTISYQFGVRRQLSDRIYMDATVFFKDIFGLVGTEALEAENESEQNQFSSNSFVNKDYGSV